MRSIIPLLGWKNLFFGPFQTHTHIHQDNPEKPRARAVLGSKARTHAGVALRFVHTRNSARVWHVRPYRVSQETSSPTCSFFFRNVCGFFECGFFPRCNKLRPFNKIAKAFSGGFMAYVYITYSQNVGAAAVKQSKPSRCAVVVGLDRPALVGRPSRITGIME